MILYKKGATGTQWALGLSFLFSLVILVFIFNMVFGFYMQPTIVDMLPDNQVGIDAEEGIQQYMDFWKIIPILIFGNVVVYMLILTFRREGTERYVE